MEPYNKFFLNKDWQSTIVSIMRPQWTNQCNELHIRSRRFKPRKSKSIFWCHPVRMETVILYFVTCLYCLRKAHSVGKTPEGVKFLRGEVELLLRDGVRVNLWGGGEAQRRRPGAPQDLQTFQTLFSMHGDCWLKKGQSAVDFPVLSGNFWIYDHVGCSGNLTFRHFNSCVSLRSNWWLIYFLPPEICCLVSSCNR